jgi:hypothetical protein
MLTLSQHRSKWDSTWLTSPRSSIGCFQYYFQAYGPFDANRAPIFHKRASTWGLSKTIFMPIVCSVQTMHLSCTDTNTVSKRTKTIFHMTHVTYEFHRVHPRLFISPWYLQCKPCTYLASGLALSPNGPNRAPPDPHHLGVPSAASKTIYEPIVRLTQIEHLSCTDANTVSKQIRTRFYKTHVN